MKRLIIGLLMIFTTYCACAQNPSPIYNRTPLTPTHYAQLPLGEIRPNGWLEEQWQKHISEGNDLEACGPYYYEVTSPTPWNVALPHDNLHSDSIDKHFVVTQNECTLTPWSLEAAPITISTRARVIPEWNLSRNSVGAFNYMSQQLGSYPEVAQWVDIELIPFGCTTLRITEFPVR